MRRLLLVAILAVGCNSGGPAGVAPTPSPTDAPLAGSGHVTFGTAYDPDTLTIAKPLTRFKASITDIAWSADLSEEAGATTLTFIFASKSSSGAERILIKNDVDVANPKFTLLANEADLGLLADRKPGTYVVRYLRASTTLAEGSFTLVK